MGESTASKSLHQGITEGLRRFPELTRDLRSKGYIKKLLVGEELFDASGANKKHPRASAMSHSDGRVYIRRLPETLKSPVDKSRLSESWSTPDFQTTPKEAALATFLHEAAHQYHFNEPSLGSGSAVEKLFRKAKTQNRTITKYAGGNVWEYLPSRSLPRCFIQWNSTNGTRKWETS